MELLHLPLNPAQLLLHPPQGLLQLRPRLLDPLDIPEEVALPLLMLQQPLSVAHNIPIQSKELLPEIPKRPFDVLRLLPVLLLLAMDVGGDLFPPLPKPLVTLSKTVLSPLVEPLPHGLMFCSLGLQGLQLITTGEHLVLHQVHLQVLHIHRPR